MRRTWSAEFGRIAFLASMAALLAHVSARPLLVLSAALAFYLGYHLCQVQRLAKALRSSRNEAFPRAGGVWGEIFRTLNIRRSRHAVRKRTLATVLNRFVTSAEAMPEALVVLREQGEIEWLNHAATRLLGLKRRQDIGKPLTNLVRHPRLAKYLRSIDYARTLEIPAPHNDALYLSVRIVPYGEGQRMLIARDTTHLHKLETIRRDFVANVSHELRTPLTVVKGYLETMTEGDEPSLQHWRGVLGQLLLQTARMQRIVDDLLELSRMESAAATPERSAVAVPPLIERLAEEGRRLSAEKGHRIDTEVDGALWLYANEGQLQSAFSNLVFNAVQHTPAGSRVWLRWMRTAEGACFEVEDDGQGIPETVIPRLTERFFRVDKARSRHAGGTGLGLAIVKHAVAANAGRLDIDSQLGAGSSFRCVFPAEYVVPRLGRASGTANR